MVIGITSKTAISGGDVTADGGADISRINLKRNFPILRHNHLSSYRRKSAIGHTNPSVRGIHGVLWVNNTLSVVILNN